MQPRVNQKRNCIGERHCATILKILVPLIIPLIVNCSGTPPKKHFIKAHLGTGDYFGGSSRGSWQPKSYVPPEIDLRSIKRDEGNPALE